MEFWYRRKYNLTSSDPRFLDATTDEMFSDYWAHYYADNPKAHDEVADDDFNLEDELARIELEDSADEWEELA